VFISEPLSKKNYVCVVESKDDLEKLGILSTYEGRPKIKVMS
jgi:hypothetical protein